VGRGVGPQPQARLLAIDGEDILSRIRRLPISTWRYTAQGGGIRHIGPMAQDWDRAFGLSGDSLTINSGDFDGVNLAAVQALERRTAQQAAEIAAQRAEIAALREQNRAVAERLARVEACSPPGRTTEITQSHRGNYKPQRTPSAFHSVALG
jgi:hypothetical protein